MITAKQVSDRVILMSDFDDDEIEKLYPFCVLAEIDINERIKPDANQDDPRLLEAAATMAMCDYAMTKYLGDEGATSFKAGDVTINIDSEALLKNFVNRRSDALIAASSLLYDKSFFFRSV